MESYQSQDITELAKAMLKVQGQLQPAMKDKENPFTKSHYATLKSVMDTCRDALIANGIWLIQHPVPVDQGHMGLVTKLVHSESGQWQSSLLVMPLPKADPQGYGSALTYGRRYSLSDLVGIVTEDDDDGEAASRGKTAKAAQADKAKMKESDQTPRLPARSGPASPPAPAAMPKIDGISYETVSTTDGKLCIIATGDTNSKKRILIQAGFRWSQERKIWWRYAEAA
jgi:hypothetical protein